MLNGQQYEINKGPSIKDVRTFLRKKTSDFLEIYSVSARSRGKGVEPVRRFCRQGRGVNFLRFCTDVFYGRPLIGLFYNISVFSTSVLPSYSVSS